MQGRKSARERRTKEKGFNNPGNRLFSFQPPADDPSSSAPHSLQNLTIFICLLYVRKCTTKPGCVVRVHCGKSRRNNPKKQLFPHSLSTSKKQGNQPTESPCFVFSLIPYNDRHQGRKKHMTQCGFGEIGMASGTAPSYYLLLAGDGCRGWSALVLGAGERDSLSLPFDPPPSSCDQTSGINPGDFVQCTEYGFMSVIFFSQMHTQYVELFIYFTASTPRY